MKWYSWIILPITFISGFYLGSLYEESSWIKKELSYKQQVINLQETIKKRDIEYANLSSNIQTRLANARRDYENQLHTISSTYADKLLKSEQRAKIYQSQASKGESERRDLASYASKLDRSLTESRELVKELTELIRLRDAQCILLGKQIIIERKVNE